MNKITTITNLLSTILLTVSAIIIFISLIKKLLIKKYDKNKNGKLEESEKEEILKENHDYIMSFLGDTLKVITKGIMNDIGCKVETAEKLILKSFNEMTCAFLKKLTIWKRNISLWFQQNTVFKTRKQVCFTVNLRKRKSNDPKIEIKNIVNIHFPKFDT